MSRTDDPIYRGREAALEEERSADEGALAARVSEVPFWWHSVRLREGVVTPGSKSLVELERELELARLPDLTGKTVLDVGAWDGFFSFAAERRGAARVVALDHYMWSVDLERWLEYRRDRFNAGEPIEPVETVPELWRPDALPGKRGFDVAHEALDSSVEAVVGDFMEMDLRPLGQFDVVLYLGVLYHVKDPFRALRRVAEVTRELAVIETAVANVRGYEGVPLCEFVEGDAVLRDPSNWWFPNVPATLAMCRAAGFRDARKISGRPSIRSLRRIRRHRGHVHASK